MTWRSERPPNGFPRGWSLISTKATTSARGEPAEAPGQHTSPNKLPAESHLRPTFPQCGEPPAFSGRPKAKSEPFGSCSPFSRSKTLFRTLAAAHGPDHRGSSALGALAQGFSRRHDANARVGGQGAGRTKWEGGRQNLIARFATGSLRLHPISRSYPSPLWTLKLEPMEAPPKNGSKPRDDGPCLPG